jgi:hypothetical protein
MNRFVLLCCFALCFLAASAANAQQVRRWSHQIGIELGPQYAFDAALTTPNGHKMNTSGIGLGVGGALNYYYQFEPPLFLSVSAALGYFTQGSIRREIPTLGTNPIVSTISITSQNPMLNFAVTAGVRYNLALTGLQPYIGLEFGAYTIGYATGPFPTVETAPNLAATPKIGLRYMLQPGLDFDASAKLMYLFSGYAPFSYASINVGISYALSYYANDK